MQLDLALQARDEGMREAISHAESESPGWSDVAYLFLCKFAREHATFISEDVSDASREWGMVQPPTDRAWGSVYKRAAGEGIIHVCGTGRSRRRHASICPLWQSNATS